MSAPIPISERLGCPTCGAVFRQDFGYCPIDKTTLQPLDEDPLIGATLADRYVIERCVGEGGMGRVYRARHRKLDRLFAVKVLYGDLAASPKMRSRFEREAKNAGKLEHPRLVSVVDFDITDGGLLYLAMSYVEGRELAMIVEDEAPLATERVVRLLRQLCDGLGYAHDQGMVHRDFKGQNVLVSGHGVAEQVHILDFGLAFMREGPESARLTTQGVVMGTPAYMSPEQAMNQALDHRTDLFSLGVLLYEMLAGTLPFQGTPVEVARQNMAADPPPIARRVPGLRVDPGLESISFRLMEKLPQDRFQSAHEVLAALDGLATGNDMTRSLSMYALAPRSSVDTAGITENIQVIVQGDERAGASQGMRQTAPVSQQVPSQPAPASQPVPAQQAPASQPLPAQPAPASQPVPAQQAAASGVPATVESTPSASVSILLVEPEGEKVVTERVRPVRSGSWRVAVGVIVAALLALLVWRVSRGPAPPQVEPEVARIASSGAEAPGPSEPAAEVAAPTPSEPAAEVVPGLDQPAATAEQGRTAATPGDVPAAPASGQRPRPRSGGASTAAPVATPGRDPKDGAAAGSPAGSPSGSSSGSPAGPSAGPSAGSGAGEADDELEKPPDETEGPDLVTLYERVGQKIAAFEGARGKDAASALWAQYRTIPLADALRTPSLGQEAVRKLRQIERDLKRAQSKPR